MSLEELPVLHGGAAIPSELQARSSQKKNHIEDRSWKIHSARGLPMESDPQYSDTQNSPYPSLRTGFAGAPKEDGMMIVFSLVDALQKHTQRLLQLKF